MDYPGPLGAEGGQHLGERLDPGLGEDAEKLKARACRVGERTHRLKMVRVGASSTLEGPTCRMALW